MNDKIKQNIRRQFNKAAFTYDDNCTIQQAVCEESLALLTAYSNQFETIADFACGTGESTVQLISAIHYKKGYGIDFAESLLAVAQKKLSHCQEINWIHGDFELPIFNSNSLNLIFCNMGLQWARNLEQSIKQFRRYLKPAGALHFSLPIAGNFPEIAAPFKLAHPTHEQLKGFFRNNQWDLMAYNVAYFPAIFGDQLAALKSLKATGANVNMSANRGRTGLASVKLNHIFKNNNSTQLTYKVGTYLAKKRGL